MPQDLAHFSKNNVNLRTNASSESLIGEGGESVNGANCRPSKRRSECSSKYYVKNNYGLNYKNTKNLLDKEVSEGNWPRQEKPVLCLKAAAAAAAVDRSYQLRGKFRERTKLNVIVSEQQ